MIEGVRRLRERERERACAGPEKAPQSSISLKEGPGGRGGGDGFVGMIKLMFLPFKGRNGGSKFGKSRCLLIRCE